MMSSDGDRPWIPGTGSAWRVHCRSGGDADTDRISVEVRRRLSGSSACGVKGPEGSTGQRVGRVP
eukprot:3617839-Rhodomonas_salina.1